jgi:hypothetical protein
MKQHQEAASLCFGVLKWNDIQLDDTLLSLVMVRRLATHRRLFGDRFLDDSLEVDLESRADELSILKLAEPGAGSRKAPVVTAKLQDVQQWLMTTPGGPYSSSTWRSANPWRFTVGRVAGA